MNLTQSLFTCSRISISRAHRLTRASAVLAVLAVLGPLAQARPSGAGASEPHRLVTGPDQRLTLLAGRLTAPSTEASDAVAARFLAARPALLGGADPSSLRLTQRVSLARGSTLRYQQTVGELPVIGGATVVRVDARGAVRWASSSAQDIPGTLSLTPVLSAREALAQVGSLAGHARSYTDTLDVDQTTRLAIYAMPAMTEPRLVYWVELPFQPARMHTIRAFVDAETGHVYRIENRVMSQRVPACAPDRQQRAYVFEQNPVDTPDLTCVSFKDMLVPEAKLLINADITTGNCTDNDNCRAVELGSQATHLHWCDDHASAQADADGDFTHYVFEDHALEQDPFSEIQMFYHLNKAYNVARSLGGFTGVRAKPLGAVVNFRIPFDLQAALGGDNDALLEQLCGADGLGTRYQGGKMLYTFDNAFYVPAGGFLGYPQRDTVLFGQGAAVDYAYDGDVIAHEFGHAVMDAVAPNLTQGFIDAYGFNSTPGGMHEGYADLMTMFVTDDPEVGEYAGQGLGLEYIRNLDNDATCPADLIGEVHDDSLPLTGAIWEARTATATTAEQTRLFDQAVFAAQQGFTELDDFGSAAMKTAAELELALGVEAAATARAIFTARGLDDCDNRIIDGSQRKSVLFTGGAIDTTSPVPAPVQWRYELGASAPGLMLEIERSLPVSPGAVLELMLKRDAPITWSQSGGTITSDHQVSARVRVVDPVDRGMRGIVQEPLEPGTYYVQLAATGGQFITIGQSLAPWDGVLGLPDAGPGGGADTDEGGCGCSVGQAPAHAGGSAGGVALAGLGVLAMIVLRRRRRDGRSARYRS